MIQSVAAISLLERAQVSIQKLLEKVRRQPKLKQWCSLV